MSNYTSKTASQAIHWLDKLGIEVKPALPFEDMVEFEYAGVLMLLNTGQPEGIMWIYCPLYLEEGNEESNKQTFETITYMTSDDLKNCGAKYLGNGLAYIDKAWKCPENRRILRRYQLIKMLDEISNDYYTLMAALAIVRMSTEILAEEYASENKEL